MPTRILTALIGLALASTSVFAFACSTRNPPSRTLPSSPAFEGHAPPASSPKLATPDASALDVVSTPIPVARSTNTIADSTQIATPTTDVTPMAPNAFGARTLRGWVVDANGNSVVANVSAMTASVDGGPAWNVGSTRSNADGWFEISHFKRGVVQLFADAEGHGTGVLRDVDLDDVQQSAIEIVIIGPGIVRGQVLDDSGRPVPEFELLLYPAELDDQFGDFFFTNTAPEVGEREGRGHTFANVTTDAEGRFDVRGLRTDDYVIRSWNLDAGLRDSMTPAPIPSDGAPIELRIHRTYLAVRVVDEQGEPFSRKVDSGATRSSLGSEIVAPLKRWPEDVCVVVMPSATNGHHFGGSSPRFLGSESIEGDFVHPVLADRTYRVGLMGGSQPWKPIDVVVPPLAGRVEVVVQAADVGAMGTLAVTTRSKDGEELERGFSIRIEDVADGATLLADRFEEYWLSPVRFDLPEGRYRVVVRGTHRLDMHGSIESAADFGTFEAEVSIVRGATTSVDATLPVGARIELELTGEVLEEDRAAVLAGSTPQMEWDDRLEEASQRARVSLRAANRWPTPIEFHREEVIQGAKKTYVAYSLALGTKGTSGRLPAGEFRFEARMPGGRVVTRDVTLVDGETLKLVLAMPSVPAHAVSGK